LEGLVTARGQGRDLLTTSSDATSTLAETAVEAQVDFRDGRIARIDADPALPHGQTLVGASAYSGFRRTVGALIPDDLAAHTVRYQVVDDLPIALLLSGRVVRAEGIGLGEPGRMPPTDVCAGWVAGGFAVHGFSELGPPLTIGPRAGALSRPDDADSWHPLDPSVAHSTRRQRRLDVWIEDGIAMVDTAMQDSFVDRNGAETAVHQYGVRATVDLVTRRFVSVAAVPGRLPFPECPSAASTADRLVGGPTTGLRDWVSASLTGPATCTHLNDSLRSLEGVGALLDHLEPLVSTPTVPPGEGHHGADPGQHEEQQ
jgi:hypothetical protein